MLKNREDISGVSIEGKEIKILQMADDTTIMTGEIEDIPKILELLQDFQDISGLKTNVDKTIAYRLGQVKLLASAETKSGLSWKLLPVSLLQ
jgi:uncharacterized protein YdaL